jgi:hypothetical protein
MIARLRLLARTAVSGFMIVYQLLSEVLPPQHVSYYDLL